MSTSGANVSVSSPRAILASPKVDDTLTVQESLTDEELLARLGYKQEFKRDFGHLELFGMSFSIVGVVQGIA